MADKSPASPVEPAPHDEADSRLEIKPLTRGGYKRLPAVERQIVEVSALDANGLVERARNGDKGAPEYLAPEALIYFIRRADRDGDRSLREGLFRELLERCTPFFRGQFRGCNKQTREDLQQEVLKKMIEDLLASDDRADFMEARFWLYLKRRTIDVCKTAFEDADKTESLDTGYSDDGESGGQTKLDLLMDTALSPEQQAMLSQGLAKLPHKLRQLYLLRHQVGIEIGSDNPDDDPPGKLTLARHYGCTGRTIRNRLKEADGLLAEFRGRKDDDTK